MTSKKTPKTTTFNTHYTRTHVKVEIRMPRSGARRQNTSNQIHLVSVSGSECWQIRSHVNRVIFPVTFLPRDKFRYCGSLCRGRLFFFASAWRFSFHCFVFLVIIIIFCSIFNLCRDLDRCFGLVVEEWDCVCCVVVCFEEDAFSLHTLRAGRC